MIEGKIGASPNAARNVHRKGRKGPKPKMTKDERREKYTVIARKQREKHITRKRDKNLVCYRSFFRFFCWR